MYNIASNIWLAFLGAALFLPATAQFLIESLSFGHQDKLSPNGRSIPGWQLVGNKHTPQLLSDRVILTPPAPGKLYAALLADTAITYPQWTLDLEFRASGPDRGGGSLQIWFTKEKLTDVELSSVYTIGQFDGLVVVLDQYGGTGGAVRGFLNDGSVPFNTHHNLDSLAFGHCDYAYRNLGKPSKVRMKQAHDGFEILVEDMPCFESSQIQLPSQYFFSVSAESAETPDSFEVNKFIVSTTNAYTREEPKRDLRSRQSVILATEHAQQLGEKRAEEAQFEKSNDFDQTKYTEMITQLQHATESLSRIQNEIGSLNQRMDERHLELKGRTASSNQIDAIDRRIQSIEATVRKIKADIEGRDYKDHLTGLQAALEATQDNLMKALPQSMSQIVSSATPKMGLFLFVVLAFQVMLAGAYIVYKRRRANSPKKFL